jgi:hypothetical protein
LVFQLPTDLPLELTPFAFLVGLWRGNGVISYTDGDKELETEFSQTLSFTHNGDNYLKYESNVQSTKEGLTLPSEIGYWRLARDAQAGDPGPGLLPATGERDINTREDLERYRNKDDGFDIEAGIMQPSGISELYFGNIKGGRVQLATDAVLRSPHAKEYTAGQRMFGLVDGALLWAWDIAALGNPLSSHASARLERES